MMNPLTFKLIHCQQTSTTSAYCLGQTDGHAFVESALDADEQNELI